jgi:hypothetical protein
MTISRVKISLRRRPGPQAYLGGGKLKVFVLGLPPVEPKGRGLAQDALDLVDHPGIG